MPAYYFLFTQGLNTTNIQFAELKQLLRLSAHPQPVTIIPVDGRPETIAQRTYYIQQFAQSCIVYVDTALDLEAITRRSGYIHSCGPLIECSPWDEMDATKLVDSIVTYASQLRTLPELRFHEDSQRGAASTVNATMIDFKRSFLGRSLLVNKAKDIREEIARRLQQQGITEPLKEGGVFVLQDIRAGNAEPERALRYEGSTDVIHIIAYHSQHLKHDALQTLDEGKPFWAGIFTTPQDLTSAALNLAAVKPGDAVYDPFSHQGSTALQAGMLGCKMFYSDMTEILGTRDNVQFLAQLSPPEREQVLQEMEYLLGHREAPDHASHDWQQTGVELSQRAAASVIHPVGDATFATAQDVTMVREQYPELLSTLARRLVFYLFRRSYIRSHDLPLLHQQGAAAEGSRSGVAELREYHRRLLRGTHAGDDVPTLRVTNVPNPQAMYAAFQAIIGKGAIPLRDRSIDAVIADPPYGYGTEAHDDELVKVYDSLIREAFRILKPGGYLVMCLLDKVKTGKKVDKRTGTEGVISMVRHIAHETGTAFEPLEQHYPDYRAYSLYYWKSKHALNRAILVARIKKA